MATVRENPLSAESSQAESLSPALVEKLIDAARQAPSPDNNQPWRFRALPEHSAIDVFHCRSRAIPSDVGDMFSWIGIGAAIENLALAASTAGLSADVEYKHRPFDIVEGCEHVARVRFEPSGVEDPLAASISSRTTNRKLYRRERLPKATLDGLTSVVTDSGSHISWLENRRDLKQLARLVQLADRIRFEHRPFHEEFHGVLRFGEEAARKAGDGLELKTLEVPALAGPVFRWLRPWKRMRFANRFGLSRMFAQYSGKQVRRSAAVGLLTTKRRSDETYLEAGRSFQRVWLAATERHLAFQPLGGLPLFVTKLAVEGDSAFLPEHARRLKPVAEELRELFPILETHVPVMLFRIGYADPPSARSGRFSEGHIAFRPQDSD